MPEHTPKQSGHRAGLPIERIVIDECFGPDSPLLAQLTGRLRGHPVELVFLAARHPGIPDVEILDKLLDGRTALLTRDRALHNLTIDQLKQFRTKRRRIRAHFGSADNIAANALTIGQRRIPRGIVGGYVLKVDARHGAKSLSPASEGYFLDPAGGSEPLQALVWALAHVLMLQLEQRPLTLFLCDSDVAETCAALMAGRNTGRNSVERIAVRLLATAKQPQAQACVKGRFFDRMQAKLDQLTAHDSNELVPIDLQAMADALELSNAGGDDFQ